MSPTVRMKGESRKLTDVLLADIIGISADAIICVDADQKITLFNDGAERVFGWTAAEAMGQPLEMLLPERVRVDRTLGLRLVSLRVLGDHVAGIGGIDVLGRGRA